ncbi:MAG: N-6 DNA methylase [Candidatus Nitrosopelagicus sp.]|jgi:type I restriction enzyme M protein|nr:N-6 DNA methylase [Candidatus Nitrosopelagicus sp.]
MAKKKEQKEKSLEQTLYDTAELQRGKVAPSDYKDIALGLLFLKFITYWYDQRREEIEKETKDESEKNRNYLLNLKKNYTSEGVFFLKEDDRWSGLMNVVSSEPNLAIKIDKILQQIEKDNPSLEKVLPDVFATSEVKNDNLQQLIENFDSIKTNEISKDTFGRIYEYFLKMFHKKSGEKGGEFFTPKSIVELLVEILEPYNGIIYDPTCGSGGMFVQSFKFLDEHKINNKNTLSPYGIESRPDIWRICKMNLAMRGINSNNILGPYDCLVEHPLEDLKANYIIANPPFRIGAWGHEKLKNDVRFAKYGVPSSGKPGGDYAFLSHMIYHLDEKNGKLGIVLDNGSMSVTGQDKKIRQAMIEDDLIDCMITLPTNLFFTTPIAACLWFVVKNKDDKKTRMRKGETLFIHAREIFTKIDSAHNELSIQQIQQITDTYRSYTGQKGYPPYKDMPGYCKVVKKEDIAKKKYVLTPSAHIGLKQLKKDKEAFPEKMKRLTQEYVQLKKKSSELDEKINANLAKITHDK